MRSNQNIGKSSLALIYVICLDHPESLLFIFTVCAMDDNFETISCIPGSSESFTVIWKKLVNAEFYVITWYSITEYRNIVENDAIDFRDVVLDEYEENLKK